MMMWRTLSACRVDTRVDARSVRSCIQAPLLVAAMLLCGAGNLALAARGRSRCTPLTDVRGSVD